MFSSAGTAAQTVQIPAGEACRGQAFEAPAYRVRTCRGCGRYFDAYLGRPHSWRAANRRWGSRACQRRWNERREA